MRAINNGNVAPRITGWLLVALLLPAVGSAMLIRKMLTLRRLDKVEAKSHLHLISGLTSDPKQPLFTARLDSGGALAVTAGVVNPSMAGTPTKFVTTDGQDVLIGEYFYRFYRSADSSHANSIQWELAGFKLRAGGVAGRNPAYDESNSLTFEPRTKSSERQHGEQVPVWLDGMPIRAFAVDYGVRCRPIAAACIQILGGTGRVTLETRSTSNDRPSFRHLRQEDFVGVSPEDILWIADLPFHIRADLAEKGAFDVIVDTNRGKLHGRRDGLGSFGFHGSVEVSPGDVLSVEDVTSEFRTGHLLNDRWSPESEDQYQLLIDSGLLCLAYVQEGGVVTPRIEWTDLAAGACRDPLAHKPSIANASGLDVAVPAAAMRNIYALRRREDGLIRRANERLRALPAGRPQDLPFTFEWWPVRSAGGAVVEVPVRLWGVRTGATAERLEVTAAATLSPPASQPAIMAARRDGVPVRLAVTSGGIRRYNYANLNGLGPLIGYAGTIDGLDSVALSGAQQGAPKDMYLTVDADLQASLWRELKNVLAGVTTTSDDPLFSVTGVVMDSVNGNLLAVLNWPAGLYWEDSEKLKGLESGGSWGLPFQSLNGAMLRADKVGSVFKLLTIYAMAEAGVLDAPPREKPGLPSCEKLPLGALQTRADGTVHILGAGFHDNQSGPVPVGPHGLSDGVDQAAASSCNTFFALAAAMVLGGTPAELDVTTPVQACPLDHATLRRTDRGRESSRKWLFCRAALRGGEPSNWLLLPENEDLAGRSHRAFEVASPSPSALKVAHAPPGYFGRAIEAGFRFGTVSGSGGLSVQGLDYENVAYRDDWLAGLPGAERRVFNYPAMFTPLTHFGGSETVSGRRVTTDPGSRLSRNWRDFVSQAIGEAGQGSALSLAVLYSAVLNNGAAVAPRLLGVDQTAASYRQMFSPRPERIKRIQQILLAPLGLDPLVGPTGTARGLATALKKEGVGTVFGKTGTFGIEYRAGADRVIGPATGRDCGFVPQSSLVDGSADTTILASAWFATRPCEDGRYVVTQLHRYPEGLQPLPPVRQGADSITQKPIGCKEALSRSILPGELIEACHTSFAAVLPSRTPQGHPIVATVIVDMDEYKTHITSQFVMKPLLRAVDRWMKGEGEKK